MANVRKDMLNGLTQGAIEIVDSRKVVERKLSEYQHELSTDGKSPESIGIPSLLWLFGQIDQFKSNEYDLGLWRNFVYGGGVLALLPSIPVFSPAYAEYTPQHFVFGALTIATGAIIGALSQRERAKKERALELQESIYTFISSFNAAWVKNVYITTQIISSCMGA